MICSGDTHCGDTQFNVTQSWKLLVKLNQLYVAFQFSMATRKKIFKIRHPSQPPAFTSVFQVECLKLRRKRACRTVQFSGPLRPINTLRSAPITGLIWVIFVGKNVYIKLSGYTCLCARLDQTQSRIKRVFTSAITSEMVLFYNILPKLFLQAPPLFYLFLLSSYSLWKISRVGNTRFFKFRREIVNYISSPRESNYFAYFTSKNADPPLLLCRHFFLGVSISITILFPVELWRLCWCICLDHIWASNIYF